VKYVDIKAPKPISKIGLGTWQFGASEWGYGEPYAEREATAIVRRAVELGVTLFDTAEIYGAGRSERILGRALGEHRGSVFLATKIFPVLPGARAVRQRALASARRLGVTGIDLYQAHWPNPLIRQASLMGGMRWLRQAGRVTEVGVSSYSLEQWKDAEAALGSRVLSNQVSYSLVARAPERDLLPFAEADGRLVIAYSPLGMGLLSGRYHGARLPTDRVRSASSLFRPEFLERTGPLIAVLRDVADAHHATPAQIALAWAIRSPAVTAIPGAATVQQLESNVAAAEISLASDEHQALSAASAELTPAETRPGTPLRRRRAAVRSNLGALKHTAKGGWMVAQTMWFDHRHQDSAPAHAPQASPGSSASRPGRDRRLWPGHARPGPARRGGRPVRSRRPADRADRAGRRCWRR
jgi:aryl-alcohol dehydrogenase-like predicted oxidoreductase